MGDGAGNAWGHRKGCGIDGGNVHSLAESGGDDHVGTDAGRTVRRSYGNHGRWGQAWDPVMVRIAASSHGNERQECCERDLASVLFTHQPCLSLLQRSSPNSRDSVTGLRLSVPHN